MIERLAKPLMIGAVVFAGLVSVGGGATFVALKVTTDSKFCNSCHFMEPYVQSWSTSSHKFVPCVDCHYEPGLLETVEGKFKALSQLAKYATGTQGTKPWAEVSDFSCMRSGCHTTRLLEGEIQYGRIRFDHRDHLFGERRGMKLRCTSCHSQIVQGNHLTVTPSTCILCHFKKGTKGDPPINQCDRCHGPPQGAKDIGGGQTFLHADYLKRGVACASCHGDVTRGEGEVPRQRCGNCHNNQGHIDRYDDLEFVHRHHVTEHSVACRYCHEEMKHDLPPRDKHFQGDCKACHQETHGTTAGMVRGTGGRGVPDQPGIMFLARVTCNGCHRPPFPDAPVPPGGATFEADPLACVDCHGPGFDGMTGRWQAEFRATSKAVRARVEDLKARIDAGGGGDLAAARARYQDAAYNLSLALLDKSDGVHNLPYARSLLGKAASDSAEGVKALDPKATLPEVHVGPKTPSKDDCTSLCHVGIEERKVDRAFGYGFSHSAHLTKAAMDCSACHAARPHGTVKVKPADCAACHHPRETDTEGCSKCHVAVAEHLKGSVEGVPTIPMQDLDCAVCHTAIATGHKRADVQAACLECHKTDPADAPARKASENLDAWLASVLAPLDAVEARLADAPPDVAMEVRRDLEALRRAGPWHNLVRTKAETKRLNDRLDAAGRGR